MNISGLWNQLFIHPSPINQYICEPTKVPYHDVVFQTGHILIFLSFLSPSGLYGSLCLRGLISFGHLILAVWSYINICSLDLFFWNVLFVIINFVYFFITLARIHPFITFPREVELVYR